MKIIKKIACASLLLFLASCGSKTSYWNALPEQSAAVASVDLSRLATCAGLQGEEGKAGVDRLKEMIKSGLEGSGQLVDRVFADATESGIDFNDKIYVFSSEENAVFGLLAKVTSSTKLEDVIHSLAKEQLCQPISETDGCNWTVLGKWLLAYSDNALLVLSDNRWSDPAKLVRQASMWLRQEEGQGFAAKEDFRQLQSLQSEVSLWTSLQIFPRNIITPLTMGLSAELDLKKVKAITTVNFESGKIVLDIDPLITDRVMKNLMDKKAQAMEPIKGSHLDLFPAKTKFWTSARLKGHDFYQFMRNIPAVCKFFDYTNLPITLDYSRIFEAIDGDVSFSITDSRRGEFILYADVKQADILNVFTELCPMFSQTNGMLQLEDTGKDAYCFSVRNGSVMNLRPGPKNFWLGVKDNRFYFTNNEELVNQHVLGLSLRNKEWGKRVVGMNFFAVTDWSSLIALEWLMQKNWLDSVPKVLPTYIDHMTIESTDGQHVRWIIHQKEKSKNLIQLLFNV